MDQLLRSNVKKSIRFLERHQNLEVDEKLVSITNPREKPTFDLIGHSARRALTEQPWFYFKENTVLSPQADFFGFFALRNLIRAVYIGYPYYAAAQQLDKSEFCSAPLALYYTSSFHLLIGYLASEGRVLFDKVLGQPKITYSAGGATLEHCALGESKNSVIGILTRNNKWIFELRDRTHKAKWNELFHVCGGHFERLPEEFQSTISYLNSYGSHELEDLGTPQGFQAGLARISDVRHEALYSSFAYDDFIYDGIVNRELDTDYGIDFKVRRFQELCGWLISSILDDLNLLINDIDFSLRLITSLRASVFTPPFEIVDTSKYRTVGLSQRVAKLTAWLEDRGSQ